MEARQFAGIAKKVITDNTRKEKVDPDEKNNYRGVSTSYTLCDGCWNSPVAVANAFFKAIKKRNFHEAVRYCDTIVDDQAYIENSIYTKIDAMIFCKCFSSEIGSGRSWIVNPGYSYYNGKKVVSIGNKKKAFKQYWDQRKGEYINTSERKINRGKKVIAVGYGFVFDKINGKQKIVGTTSVKWYIH